MSLGTGLNQKLEQSEALVTIGERFASWKKTGGRIRRKMRKALRKGPGYRFGEIIQSLTIILVVGVYGYFGYLIIGPSLDWNTIVSIGFADIPVGIVLWAVLQRRESANRSILDAMEIVKAPTVFSHLRVHYCDEWEDGEVPYIHYYIVNTKTNQAFFVSKEVEKLIEKGMIRMEPRYKDFEKLKRFFETNNIDFPSALPSGDDLFRDKLP